MEEDCFKNTTGGPILMMNLFKKLLLKNEIIRKYKESYMEKKDSLFLFLAWINISVSLNMLNYKLFSREI
jgi:hypothetical protein